MFAESYKIHKEVNNETDHFIQINITLPTVPCMLSMTSVVPVKDYLSFRTTFWDSTFSINHTSTLLHVSPAVDYATVSKTDRQRPWPTFWLSTVIWLVAIRWSGPMKSFQYRLHCVRFTAFPQRLIWWHDWAPQTCEVGQVDSQLFGKGGLRLTGFLRSSSVFGEKVPTITKALKVCEKRKVHLTCLKICKFWVLLSDL